MNPQFIYYNELIEKEHRKPEDQKNLALIDDWKTERAKYFDSTGTGKSSIIHIHINRDLNCFGLFHFIVILNFHRIFLKTCVSFFF